MDFLSIFTAWLGFFSIGFTFLPIGLVLDWRRRGTADGFSSLGLVLAFIVTTCWLRHGHLTNDQTNITINTINIGFFIFYLSAFAFYQPNRKPLIYQLLAAFAIHQTIGFIVFSREESAQADLMGSIAAGSQIASLAGGIYEIVRAVRMGHTEYIPAGFQYAMFFLIVQWFAFGLLTGNIYIALANAAGLLVNLLTIGLYFIYPPLTWRVPLIGTGPQQKEEQKKE